MKIGIITAMSSEQKQLANQLTEIKESSKGPFSYIEGKINSNEIVLMQCGIGKVNAAAEQWNDKQLPARLYHQYRCGRRYRHLSENNGCSCKPQYCISRRMVRRR